MNTATKERPILLSPEMIRAILDGRKTQTRYPVKPQPRDGHEIVNEFGMWVPRYMTGLGPMIWTGDGDWKCPFGRRGDRLWVRETWAPTMDSNRGWNESSPDGSWPIYAATDREWDVLRWRPSIHMPRWASRITLEITGVRAERLQSISEADKLAEGATPDMPFGTVWRKLHTEPPHRWEDNPWVWAIDFRRVEGEVPA